MKKLLHYSLCLICTLTLFTSCSSVDNYGATKSVAPVVTNGNWKVILFMDNNNDQTNDYNGFVFKFSPSGDVSACKNGNIVAGTWNENNTAKNITLYFHTTDPVLNKLNDTWGVKQLNNNQVNLENEGKPFSGKLNIINQ